MNASRRRPSAFRPLLFAALAGVALGACAAPQSRAEAEPVAADDGLGECRLPPQIRKLGHNLPYLAAGRQIRTSASECRIRGGEFRAPAAARAEAASDPNAPIGITVGLDAGRPACPATGVVVGLAATSTLTVRTGPATRYARIDRLGNGRALFLCDRSGDGEWIGVVIPRQPGMDCGVGASVPSARAYSGQCGHGWVNAQWVREHR